jgi:ABC-type polysaccharide/polyol phosphate transport system ATPase subunit
VSCAVRVAGLGIRFLFDRQQRPTTPALAKLRRRCSEAWGLRGVDLEIGPGESVGFVGPNGAGKTTLLRVIGGVLEPDQGTVRVRGRIGSLLSTEAGLLLNLTGRENCALLGVLAGMSRAQAREALDLVKERTRLGDAFDRPVSSYSQGMRARLGFAVVERAAPQILLLDEVHEALDREFREVMEARAEAIVASGGIVIAAGHDRATLARLCRRAVELHDGTIRADGPFAEVAGSD